MKCGEWAKLNLDKGIRRKIQGKKTDSKGLGQQASRAEELRGQEPRAEKRKGLSCSYLCVYLLFLVSFMFAIQLKIRFTI